MMRKPALLVLFALLAVALLACSGDSAPAVGNIS